MTTTFSDADLYIRGVATLLASWEAYTQAATGAAIHRDPGVAAAVFPHDPERAITTTPSSTATSRPPPVPPPWTRWRPPTLPPASPTSPPGSTSPTPRAECVYAAVGFRDLGRFLEYVPVSTRL